MYIAIWDDREGFTLTATGDTKEAAVSEIIRLFNEIGEDGAALVKHNPTYLSVQESKGLLQPGTPLPNGAIVLLERSGVVLALNNCGTRDEFVTWRWDGKDPRSTYWGHYHRKFLDAARDFEERVDRYAREQP